MHFPLLFLGGLDLIVVLALGLWIQHRYKLALTSVAEKRAGLLHYYRGRLVALVDERRLTTEGGLTALHYMALHLAIPLVGLGLYLRTDANFLFVLLGGFFSMKLVQRVYPGTRMDEDLPER